MPINSEPGYFATCDNCGKRADYGDYCTWSTVDGATESTLELDWFVDSSANGPVILCETCGPPCAKCPNPAGADADDEREGLCRACFDEADGR